LYNNKRIILGAITIVLITAVFTFMISVVVFTGDLTGGRYEIRFSPENVSENNVRKFNEVKKILKERYYGEVDENVLLEGAVKGMADSLGDIHTVYYNKEQMQKILEISSKSVESYVGIGVTVTMDKNGVVTVVEPFKDSPAYNAGMKMGDKIIAVDGEDVTQIKDLEVIVKMIKGPENTNVKLTVYRSSDFTTKDFNIIRKKIKVELNIRSEMLDSGIGYIRILSFNDKNIALLFDRHLEKLLEQNIKGLIIDLRDNLGGYYDQVVNIADRLIPKGIIVYTEDRDKNKKVENSDATELDVPIAVLVNGNSASASEVLSGALKDHKKGILVGTTTFGKGVVQEIKFLNDGSGLKVTV
jgi:carboxyl-terminal processing protease